MKTKMTILLGAMALTLAINSCTKETRDLANCLSGKDCPDYETDENSGLDQGEMEIDSVDLVSKPLNRE